jgi:hypothetical protein
VLSPYKHVRVHCHLGRYTRPIFSDETQVVVDSSNRVYNYVWRRPDEVWRHECLGLRGNCKLSAMLWGKISSGVVSLIKESERLRKLRVILTHGSILIRAMSYI